jgi:hypothetical protein
MGSPSFKLSSAAPVHKPAARILFQWFHPLAGLAANRTKVGIGLPDSRLLGDAWVPISPLVFQIKSPMAEGWLQEGRLERPVRRMEPIWWHRWRKGTGIRGERSGQR